MKRFVLSFACATLLLASADMAFAAPITFDFSGFVNSNFYDFDGIGKRFRGRFTFDDAAVDALPDDPLTGLYQSPYAAPYGYQVRSGSFAIPFVTAPITQRVNDGSLYGCSDPCDAVLWYHLTDTRGFSIGFVSFTDLLLVNGDSIITEPLDPKAPEVFAYFSYSEGDVGPEYRNVQGFVTHVREVKGVPEPSLIMLLSFAVLGRSVCVRALKSKQKLNFGGKTANRR